MPDIYNNPFSGMPNPAVYDSPFMKSWKERERTDMAQPFIQNSLNSQTMDVQKQGQEMNEFMDPTAIGRRREEMGLGLEKAQAARQLLPQQTQSEQLALEQKIKTLPLETQRMIEEQGQKLATLKGQPVANLFEEMASLHPELSKMPPPLQAQAYKQAIESYKARHPGQELPPEIEQFGPHTMDSVKHAYLTHMMSIPHRQKLDELDTTARGNLNVAKEHTNSAVQVANIKERGDNARKKMDIDNGRGIPASVQILGMRKQLSGGNLPQDKREEIEGTMKGIIGRELDQEVQHDPAVKSLGDAISMAVIQGKGDIVTQLTQQIDQRKSRLKLEKYLENGIKTLRLSEVKAAYPGKTEAKIREAAKAEGIILKD